MFKTIIIEKFELLKLFQVKQKYMCMWSLQTSEDLPTPTCDLVRMCFAMTGHWVALYLVYTHYSNEVF